MSVTGFSIEDGRERLSEVSRAETGPQEERPIERRETIETSAGVSRHMAETSSIRSEKCLMFCGSRRATGGRTGRFGLIIVGCELDANGRPSLVKNPMVATE